MHIIETGKEHVVFTEIGNSVESLTLTSKNKLLEQEVVLEDGAIGKLIILEKDNPSELISKNISIETPPSLKVFQRTENGKFTIGQKIYVAILKENIEVANFFTCMIMDIIPNGYLR